MKVGSLVVVLQYPPGVREGFNNIPHMKIDWIPVDDESTVYTVRAFQDNNEQDVPQVVLLEEGVIGHNVYSGIELGMPPFGLKEIQPPMELDELMEEINKKELFSI
jgi:hypothetical protein